MEPFKALHYRKHILYSIYLLYSAFYVLVGEYLKTYGPYNEHLTGINYTWIENNLYMLLFFYNFTNISIFKIYRYVIEVFSIFM